MTVQTYKNEYGKIVYNGKEYNSVSELANDYSINANTLRSRLSKGISLDRAISSARIDEVEYNGSTYRGIIDLCNKLDICYSTLTRKINSGKDLESSIEECLHLRDKDKYELYGKKYSSYASIAKDYGISRQLLSLKLKQGKTLEEIFPNPSQDKELVK